MNASSNLLSDAPQRTVGGSIEQRCVWCGEWTESGFLSDEGVCDECEESTGMLSYEQVDYTIICNAEEWEIQESGYEQEESN